MTQTYDVSSIEALLENIDWKLLAEQKEALVALVMDGGYLTPETTEALDGLTNFFDAFQDAAARDGYPVVFLTEETK